MTMMISFEVMMLGVALTFYLVSLLFDSSVCAHKLKAYWDAHHDDNVLL